MMIKKADQESVLKLLDNLKNDYNLAAPVLLKKGKKELVEYVFIDDVNKIYLDRQPDSSPKNIVFPQNSAVGKDYSGDKLYDPEKKTILWGVRSCDIEAIKTFDQVFIEDDMYTDQSYKAVRDKTIIVGLACEEREKSCFCDALGLNPIESDYAPIYLFIKDDQHYLKIKEKEYESLFSSLSDGDQAEFEELVKKKEEEFNSSEFELDIPIPLPEKDMFEADIWDEMSEKCLSCGVCTYYCPTCYCFNFFWDGEDQDSTRFKNWDSCMFTTYSAHASGHNPRDSKDRRYRNRIMHKFSYHPVNYEGLGCVGCGRCIDRCPVNLDIREALKLTEKYLQTKGGAKEDG